MMAFTWTGKALGFSPRVSSPTSGAFSAPPTRGQRAATVVSSAGCSSAAPCCSSSGSAARTRTRG